MALDYHFVFGIIGGVFSVVAFIPYIFSIFKKGSKPNRASWIIWNITNTIILVSSFSIGARATIFSPVVNFVFAVIILIFSFRRGVSLWSRLDYISLFIAGLSLIIWVITKNPLLALLMNLTMDSIAYLPTIKKSYIDPLSESDIAWLLFFFGSFSNLLAINSTSFGIIIYPVVIFITNGSLVVTLYRKKILFWYNQ